VLPLPQVKLKKDEDGGADIVVELPPLPARTG
jgi:hypothetical protein